MPFSYAGFLLVEAEIEHANVLVPDILRTFWVAWDMHEHFIGVGEGLHPRHHIILEAAYDVSQFDTFRFKSLSDDTEYTLFNTTACKHVAL